MAKILDWNKYFDAAVKIAEEGTVMLENNGVLPLNKGSKVALFGRMQNHYYKSGSGSGGMVNVTHIVTVREALDEDRVEVFYQPIYNTKEKTFELAEALCRIKNKDGSFMSPGVFIPVSESSGSVSLLGERVYRKVCDFYNEGEIKKLGVKNIDVNLSAIQCDNIELAKHFEKIAKDKNIDPSLISFEITETAFSSVNANMLTNMNQLIDSGFEFALDDFGKGASNLMYAIEMPVKVIKMDMELTQLFMKDEKAKAVAPAIIKMAHDMDLKVVSEGVEDAKQADIVTKAGVDFIQGYYYSKPLPKDEYIKFLKEHK